MKKMFALVFAASLLAANASAEETKSWIKVPSLVTEYYTSTKTFAGNHKTALSAAVTTIVGAYATYKFYQWCPWFQEKVNNLLGIDEEESTFSFSLGNKSE
ncbi:MAG: hypothetical protein AB7R69_05375 [Candidatus Babeliales bacterium]